MSQNKTRQNDASVTAFLAQVADERKRQESYAILALMEEISGEPAKMWGDSIIGFGSYHYHYPSGRQGNFMRIGFAPRKQNIALYLIAGANLNPELLTQLGKYKTGKSCLYINRLADVNRDVLRAVIENSLAHLRTKYPE